jgi:hypothetical protein
MALRSKRVAEILADIRDTLQDQQKARWTDQELYKYLDQGMRNVALATRYNLITETIHVGDPMSPHSTTDYELPLEAIEFKNITCKQPYEILNSRTLRFPENKDESVEVEYYAFPDRIYYGATTDLFLDEDLYDALVYYVLYKAYQKEASTENIQKKHKIKGGSTKHN